MSRALAKIEAPNGGAIDVAAYVGPSRTRRVQFTVQQGEGNLVSYVNVGADGVAQLVGALETWLLEGGEPTGRTWGAVPQLHASLTRVLELVSHLTDVVGPEAPVVDELEKVVRGALELVPAPVARAGASVDGPSPLAVHEWTHQLEHGAFPDLRPAPGARLETDDVATSLEQFDTGETLEERELEERGRRALAELTGVVKQPLTVRTIGDAIVAAEGRAEELARYCRTHKTVTGDRLEEYAVKFLAVRVRLDDILRAAANASRG